MLKSGTEMNFLLIHSQCPVWRKLTSVIFTVIFTLLPINGYLQGHNKSSGSLFGLDSLNEEIMNDNEEEEVPEEKSLIPNSCQVITK